MAEVLEYSNLTFENRMDILDQKILQYEASLWDASLELNLALAAEHEEAIGTQSKRVNELKAGLEYLRGVRNGTAQSTNGGSE